LLGLKVYDYALRPNDEIYGEKDGRGVIYDVNTKKFSRFGSMINPTQIAVYPATNKAGDKIYIGLFKLHKIMVFNSNLKFINEITGGKDHMIETEMV